MFSTTNAVAPPHRHLGQALDRLLRPAIGFQTPFDVLKDPLLDVSDKRAILASWASDASSVEGDPTRRWLLGADEPAPLSDVLEALWRLDEIGGEKRSNAAVECQARKRSSAARVYSH